MLLNARKGLALGWSGLSVDCFKAAQPMARQPCVAQRTDEDAGHR